MRFSHLRNVLAVGERGSLRAAARHLGLTQPAITRSIRELERELGVELFARTPLGLKFTAVGEKVLQRAKAIQSEIDRTLDEVEHSKGTGVGSISIGLSTAAHVAILPRIVRPFQKRFPNVRLRVAEGLFPSMEADIRDGVIDLYVGPVPRELRDRGVVVEPLFANRRVIIARRGHPLADATSIHELVDAAWVTTPVMADSENEVNAIYREAGLPPPRIMAQATSGMSIIGMVLSSDMLAPLPAPWLEVIDTLPIIIRIAIREPTYAPTICVVRRAQSPLTPAGEYLHDLILRAAANHARNIGEIPLSEAAD